MVHIKNPTKKFLPFLVWSKKYNFDTAIADLVAGITIGLTLIPQSLAYASLAGLSPEYGLYSSLCGGFIYFIFGTIPQINIAPTAILSLLTFTYTHNFSFGAEHGAVLLTFLSGIIELVCGILHLGFLVDFVSTPVVAAFTSAGAITIASSQVKNLLGLKFSAESFLDVWKNVFNHITETKKWDATLGLSCCIILILMRLIKDLGTRKSGLKLSKYSKKTIWFISVSRNAFVVIACSCLSYIFETQNMKPFSLTPEVPRGLPSINLPFNGTEITTTTLNMVKELSTGIPVVAFIAIIGNVAIAKAFAKGKVVDASQEMIAVGLCNFIGSFLGSYPVNASFSRGAVSSASGVRTPLAGIYAGIMVILSLTFLTPYFCYIPKATLAAVIICAVIFMVEVGMAKMIWTINKFDLVPFFITLGVCLFLGIEIGILVGIGVDLIILTYGNARPKILIEKIKFDSMEYILITPSTSILFPNAEFIKEKIKKKITGNQKIHEETLKIIVIDCHHINKLDFTATQCLSTFIEEFHKLKKEIIFYRPQSNIVKILNKCIKSRARIIETNDKFLEYLKNYFNQKDEIITVSLEIENLDKMTTTRL